jgi:hypothetical protein
VAEVGGRAEHRPDLGGDRAFDSGIAVMGISAFEWLSICTGCRSAPEATRSA